MGRRRDAVKNVFRLMQLNLYLAHRLYKLGQMQYVCKVAEELSELQVAYLHYLDNKASEDAVIEEIADVLIQIDKIAFELADFNEQKFSKIKYKINNMICNKIDHIKDIVKDC